MQPTERSWLAGIVDCDGCITTHNDGANPLVSIRSSNHAFLEYIRSVASDFKGHLYPAMNPKWYKDNCRRKMSWLLVFCDTKLIISLLKEIKPYLVIKKKRAEEFIARFG